MPFSEADLLVLRNFLWAELERLDKAGWGAALEHDLADAVTVDTVPMSPIPNFFARFPQLLMPLGFDEYYLHRTENEPANSLSQRIGRATVALYPLEPCFRRPTGEWAHFVGLNDDGLLAFHGSSPLYFGIEELLKVLAKDAKNENSYWLDASWTPSVINSQRVLLQDSIVPLLRQLQRGQIELDSLTPRELELLVAELLQAEGHEVIMTPSGGDGGRDILTRGWCGNIPIYMAVEVKKRPVVNIGEFREALLANEDYPALMVATSGRFAAGVLQERAKERRLTRVFLRDRSALTQMVGAYADNGPIGNIPKLIQSTASWVEEARRLTPLVMPDSRNAPKPEVKSGTRTLRNPVTSARLAPDITRTDVSWDSARTGPVYILIQTEHCDLRRVRAALRAIQGITHAYTVQGPYNIIAHADSTDGRAMGRVMSGIRMIEQITRTCVCIANRQGVPLPGKRSRRLKGRQ